MDIFLGDGIATTFILNHAPVSDNAVFMYNDSGERYFSGVDYSRNGTLITFYDLPDAGRNIYIQYLEQINIAQV